MIEKILLRVPQHLKAMLRKLAEDRGATLNQLVLQILWDWLKQNPPEQKTRN